MYLYSRSLYVIVMVLRGDVTLVGVTYMISFNKHSYHHNHLIYDSLVFIKNLINDKSKNNKKGYYLFHSLTVIYNTYKCMTYRRVHLYPLCYCIQYIYLRFQ